LGTGVPRSAKSSTPHDQGKQFAHLLFKKFKIEGKNPEGERELPQKGQEYTGSFWHLRATQSDNEPVDPVT